MAICQVVIEVCCTASDCVNDGEGISSFIIFNEILLLGSEIVN